MAIIMIVFSPNLIAQDCTINEVFAEAHPCDSDGNIFVDIEFNVENPEGPAFEIRGNGVSYGIFDYGSDFYTIGPIEGNCSTLYEFVVIDTTNTACMNFYAFDDVICCTDECEIYSIMIDSFSCNENGTYNFLLDFETQNVTNDFFDFFDDTHLINTFSYDSLPVYIEEITPRESGFDFFKICDNDNPECCEEFEFPSPECLGSECRITDLFAEAYCVDGLLFVDFEFFVDNPGTGGFIARGNGTIFGEFNYGEPFYTIGPFENCEGIDELVIIDTEYEDCFAEIPVELPFCCETITCEIGDIEIVEFECTEGPGLFVRFNFEPIDTGELGFDLFVNGEFFEFYEYSDESYRVDYPLTTDAVELTFTICDNDDLECCTEFQLVHECAQLSHSENIIPNHYSISQFGNMIYFESDKLKRSRVSLYNMSGQEILRSSFTDIGQINLRETPSGIYLISIGDGRDGITRKVMVR